MTREVSREVTEHAMLIGGLQKEVQAVGKEVTEVKGTQKEIFEKIDRTEKYLAGKIDAAHCKKEETLAGHTKAIKELQDDVGPLTDAKKKMAFSFVSIGTLWHIVTAVVLFYIAVKTFLGPKAPVP